MSSTLQITHSGGSSGAATATSYPCNVDAQKIRDDDGLLEGVALVISTQHQRLRLYLTDDDAAAIGANITEYFETLRKRGTGDDW